MLKINLKSEMNPGPDSLLESRKGGKSNGLYVQCVLQIMNIDWSWSLVLQWICWPILYTVWELKPAEFGIEYVVGGGGLIRCIFWATKGSDYLMAVLFLPLSAVAASVVKPCGSPYESYILPVIIGSEGELDTEEFKGENNDQVFHCVLDNTSSVWRRNLPMQSACNQTELITFHWKRKGCWSRWSGEIICLIALTVLSLGLSSQS